MRHYCGIVRHTDGGLAAGNTAAGRTASIAEEEEEKVAAGGGGGEEGEAEEDAEVLRMFMKFTPVNLLRFVILEAVDCSPKERDPSLGGFESENVLVYLVGAMPLAAPHGHQCILVAR